MAHTVSEVLASNIVIFTVILALLISGVVIIVLQSRAALPVSVEDITVNTVPSYIITGPPNSGKTSLFQYVSYLSGNEGAKFKELDIATTKSYQLNVNGALQLPIQSSYKKKYSLVDIPGEEKIFNQKIQEVLKNFKNVKGIVFVIDATMKNEEVAAAAKQLFKILLLSERRPNGIDILIAVNKTERFGARPVDRISQSLQQEINEYKNVSMKNLRKVDTKGHNFEDQQENDELEEIIEQLGKEFAFDKLEGNIDIIGGSLHADKIQKWIDWLDEKAVN